MKINDKAVSTSAVDKYTSLFVGIVVLFLISAELLPEAESAGDAIAGNSSSGIASLLASGGVIWTIIVAGMFLLVLKVAMPKK